LDTRPTGRQSLPARQAAKPQVVADRIEGNLEKLRGLPRPSRPRACGTGPAPPETEALEQAAEKPVWPVIARSPDLIGTTKDLSNFA